MSKINLEDVKDVAKTVGGFVALFGVFAVQDYVNGKLSKKYYGMTTEGYGDAVEAIMSSSMYSGDKEKAVSVLKRGESKEFYKAVISIAKDRSAYSGDKVNMITNMSK